MKEIGESVRRMWNDGMSYTMIAAALGGGTTRSCVAGILRTLRQNGVAVVARPNLAGRGWRPDTKALKAAGTPRQRGKQHVSRPTPAAVKNVRADSQLLCANPVPVGGGVRLTDLREGQCRWPIGDPQHADFRYCGCAVARGSYCAGHARKAFVAPRGPKNAAATDAKVRNAFSVGRRPAGAARTIMDHWL